MTDPIFFKRWRTNDPSKLQLFSLATPNGRKVSIALEELKIPYEAHLIDIRTDEQFTPEYQSLSPNGKIPTIWDPNGPDGQAITMMESGAILIYLAEKTGQLIPKDPHQRYNCLEWVFMQMASIGPMFGQFGHFHKYAGDNCDHPYPKTRYLKEVLRLLGVLEKRLSNENYLVANEYSIADIATFPWVGCLDWGYAAKELLNLTDFPNVMAWHERCASRPASETGAQVCAIN